MTYGIRQEHLEISSERPLKGKMGLIESTGTAVFFAVDVESTAIHYAHNHLGQFGGGWDQRRPADLVAQLDRAAARLTAHAARGAECLKIWKPFGLQVTDVKGNLAKFDNPRLFAIWARAGELNLPVMIHLADPVAFIARLTPDNERWVNCTPTPIGNSPRLRLFPSWSC